MAENQFVSREDLKKLLAHRSGPGTLSIYLAVTQPGGGRRGGWQMSHLRSGLKKLAQAHPGDEALEETADAALDEISGLDPQIRQRSLVYFRDAAGGFIWWRSLPRPISAHFVWMESPFIRPLVSYLDDSPDVGVILLSQDEARMLTWRQGVLLKSSERRMKPSVETERAEGPQPADPARGPHSISPVDRLRDRISQRIRRFAVEVADALPAVAIKEGWERLLLLGPSPMREEFQAQLKEPWRGLCIGSADKLMIHSGPQEIVPVLENLIERWNREREWRETQETMNLAGAGGRAVVGPDPCLRLLQQGRVLRLYYTSDLVLNGWRLADGTLSLAPPADNKAGSKPEPHLVERMVEMAFATGADVTPVEGEAAKRLMELGGMGARLRY